MSSQSTRDEFATTRWSLIHDLRVADAGPNSRSQLNELCLRYWIPIQQYVGRRGYDDGQARRLTEDFLNYLQRDALVRVERHARFREFLQTELDAFLARCGPGAAAGDGGSGDTLQRSFALEVIAHSMARLREEAIEADRLAMFEALKRYLLNEAQPGDIQREAAALTARPLFVSMAIRRLRQRFRRLVDDELSRLVTDARELAHEREAMFSALGRMRPE